jgi:hypothetical protein
LPASLVKLHPKTHSFILDGGNTNKTKRARV